MCAFQCLTHFVVVASSFELVPLCSCPQVQYMAYVGIGGLFSVLKTLFAGVVFWFMVKFSLGRGLLTEVQYHFKSHCITVENLMDKTLIHTAEHQEAYINS